MPKLWCSRNIPGTCTDLNHIIRSTKGRSTSSLCSSFTTLSHQMQFASFLFLTLLSSTRSDCMRPGTPCCAEEGCAPACEKHGKCSCGMGVFTECFSCSECCHWQYSKQNFTCTGTSSSRAKIDASSSIAALQTDTRLMLQTHPRLMWGWGQGLSGFCGSASLQTVAAFHGNFVSQGKVRGLTGGEDAAHEVVLGESECCSAVSMAKKLKLNVSQWDHKTSPRPQHDAFLAWMRASLSANEPVVFGLYMKTMSGDGFDHIVPLVGMGNNTISFNDLHSNKTLERQLDTFVASRAECKADLPWEERFAYCLPAEVSYGFRVHGSFDPTGVLLPIRLVINPWYEPDYSIEDGKHEVPILMSVQLIVNGVQSGLSYALLQYDHPESVPTRDFLSNGGYSQRTNFWAHNVVWSTFVNVSSDSTTFFRCVRARM